MKHPKLGDKVIVSNRNKQEPVEATFFAYNKHNVRPWTVVKNGRMMKYKNLEKVLS